MRAHRAERGAVAVLVLLLLVVLVASLGAALNLGHLFAVRGELQNSGDAGALAGARVLDGTEAGVASAVDLARTTGRRNPTDNLGSVDVHTPDIATGNWDVTTRVFTPLSDPALAGQINAVRVRTYRNATHASPVALTFERQGTADVAAEAIAVGGGPSWVSCAQMPLAVSECDLPTIRCNAPFTIYWNTDWSDTGGWATFPPVNVSAATVRSQIVAAGNGQCTPAGNGDMVNLLNGDAVSACKTLQDVWRRDPNHEWIIPVIRTPCPTRYVQEASIVDWIYLQINRVSCSGQDPPCEAGVTAQSSKCVSFMMLCDRAAPPGSRPGGTFNPSISPVPPALVQ